MFRRLYPAARRRSRARITASLVSRIGSAAPLPDPLPPGIGEATTAAARCFTGLTSDNWTNPAYGSCLEAFGLPAVLLAVDAAGLFAVVVEVWRLRSSWFPWLPTRLLILRRSRYRPLY